LVLLVGLLLPQARHELGRKFPQCSSETPAEHLRKHLEHHVHISIAGQSGGSTGLGKVVAEAVGLHSRDALGDAITITCENGLLGQHWEDLEYEGVEPCA